jgi:hypothetical protein
MIFVGNIIAINPVTREQEEYIETIDITNCNSIDDANFWCQTNFKGYIKITGIYDSEIYISDLLIGKIKNKNGKERK